MKTITVLILALFTITTGCTANVASSADEGTAAPLSCELLAASDTEQVFAFSDPDTAAPVGTECVSLGGGVFTCKPTACLVVAYAGSCPHCAGGGE